MGFSTVPPSKADELVVPPEYTWQVVNAWGDPDHAGRARLQARRQPVGRRAGHAGGHAPRRHGVLPAAARARSPRPTACWRSTSSTPTTTCSRPTAWRPGPPRRCRSRKNAHGIGVLEIRCENGAWRVGGRLALRPPHHRRHAVRLAGPAAGHPWMRTAADPEGRTVRGTFNNCADGQTPWGTYLSCEENVTPYFVNDSGQIPRLQDRYGVPAAQGQLGLPLARVRRALRRRPPPQRAQPLRLGGGDRSARPAVDAGQAHRPGPHGPRGRDGGGGARRPRRHLHGRRRLPLQVRAHLQVRQPQALRAGRRPRARTSDILDEGTLYAARFDADGSGDWIAARAGQARPHRRRPASPRQAEVLIDARTAADAVGATYMDRPEWIAMHPRTGEVYCTLSNNTSRGKRQAPAPARRRWAPTPPTRARPTSWATSSAGAKQGGDPAATRFRLGRLPAGRRPRARRPDQARQRPRRRRLRPARRPVLRRPRHALDPDRLVGVRTWPRPTGSTSATTRCWPPTPRPARCAASSPAPSAARSPASR